MKEVRLPSGERVPALGQGTWGLGEDPARRQEEIATLRAGIGMGLRLVDTAEMYGDGRTETLLGEALAGLRDQVFLVSKVYPNNASRAAMHKSCADSLRRLRTDRIDLYLLHWSGSVPLAETVEAFERLQQQGMIRHWGVSNLDLGEMKALWALAGGRAVQVNQLLYNLSRRGIEWDLLPWLRQHGVPVMAYSPIEQGRLLAHAGLQALAQARGLAPAQLALAWLVEQGDVVAIPKTSSQQRLTENVGALAERIDGAARAQLDKLFPPPARAVPLEMI